MKKTLIIILTLFLAYRPFLCAYPDMQHATTYLFTTENGLSSTKVTSILQEKRNFLWIGTEDGLNKFNGYNFTIYKKIPGDTLSLISNHITALFQDSRERLWVATIEGLEYYDYSHDGFVNVSLNQPDHIIKQNECTDIAEDSKGNLWFTVSGYGVLRYSSDKNESTLFSPSPEQPLSTICSNYIRSVAEDKEGKMWFASQDNGLSVYDPTNGTIKNYNTENSNLPSDAIFDLSLMRNGNMLISTLRGGLVIFDAVKKEFISYTDIFDDPYNRSIFCSLEDQEGNILVGTEGSGVLIFDPETKKLRQHPVYKEHSELIGDSKVHCLNKGNFNYVWCGLSYKGVFVYGHEKSGFKTLAKINHEPNSLSYGSVMGVTTDKDKHVWIATDGGGLNRYDPVNKKYTHFKYDPKDRSTISDNAVVSVLCDSKNRIWAGTYTGGLCQYDRNTGKFIRYRAHDSPDGLQSDYIRSIKEDKRGYLWLGTNGGGLTRFDPEQKSFRTFRSMENRGLVNDYIIILFIDSKNRLWIGTYFGLSCMDIDTESFISFDLQSGLSSLSIYSVAEDEEGTIWVGTSYGLNKYNPENNSFTYVYPKTNQYHSPVINGIIPFNEHLWLSTNHGIIRYSIKDGGIKRYYMNSGLQSNEFILGSYYKSPDNELFFGGINGVNSFYPDDIYDNDNIPKVYITSLRISNDPVSINEVVNGRIVLSENIELCEKIRLKESDKNFTLEFVGMGAFDPYATIYACKLEGFDKEWVKYDYTQRSITYTNLNPGTYTFRIKASSNPDIWGEEETNLIIEIEPAVWNSWWARLIYLIITFVLSYILLRFILTRFREKNELQIERFKLRQQEEINEAKTNFFTNISHEFRTPLTLLIGPLERMIEEEDNPESKKTKQLMLRNAYRLERLINQILDLNKMEDGKMTLHVREFELVSFLLNAIEPFDELLRRKKIKKIFSSDPDNINVWYDPDMLDKIISNLVYNAYKFTAEGGSITVDVRIKDDGYIHLRVTDTGIGMDKQTSEHIFDRFFQGNNKILNTGTGIGMHLTKTIVELHKGSISVDSQEGIGTSIYITILPGSSHFSPAEIADGGSDKTIAPPMDEEDEAIAGEEADSPQHTSVKEKIENLIDRPTLLLVEDDYDMRYYIKQELKKQYLIEEAVNGKEGLEKARKILPDLIITDVMMPEMDGIELCRTIKSDPRTNHIPIIILTAQGGLQHRLEGLETGADSYISKPFSTKHLRIRIDKLIEVRRIMKERFSKSINMDAQEVTLTSTDERLLQNAIDYIRTNIESPDLSVEAMSKELGLSRTHLHRKLKALTGQSPVEFIKMIRMKQAAYLLGTGKLSVSEVGYKVGYNTPSYFSSSFNAYFGMSPTAYMEKEMEKNKNMGKGEGL